MDDKFAIALSEKTGEEATREVSLKIKATFPKAIRSLSVFFTPQFQPGFIISTVQFTLKPQTLIGVQVPHLIFDDRIIDKGVLVCCINEENTLLKVTHLRDDNPQNIESNLRMSLRNFGGEHQFLFPFLDQHYDYTHYIQAVDLSVKKGCRVFGGGFIYRYGNKNHQIVQNAIDEGLINTIGHGLQIDYARINGLLPLGKPFTVTKTVHKKNVVVEINGRPAIDLYKHYLDEKFPLFRKNGLFPFYPLGIKKNGIIRLVHIIDILEDGSFVCAGEIKTGDCGHIMMAHPQTLRNTLKEDIKPLLQRENGLVFIVNSMLRKKMLKEYAAEEIKLLKEYLGDDTRVAGVFTDYCIFSDDTLHKTVMEPGVLLASLWK